MLYLFTTLSLKLNTGNGIDTKMAAIWFISWNVKVLNWPVKRDRILNHLKYLKCDVTFLQEIHLLSKDQVRLKKGWVGNVFHSNLNPKLVEQPYWFIKKIQFNVTSLVSDPHGLFVMVSGLLYHKPVVLVNIYAPNLDDDKLMGKISSLITDLNSQQLIFGGDLNGVMNLALDYFNLKLTNLSKTQYQSIISCFFISTIIPFFFLFFLCTSLI